MRNNNKRSFLNFFGLVCVFLTTACSSIYSGGTSGRIVDGESTSNPKTGISDVEVYAYTSEAARNSDFSSWKGDSRFTPRASYYAHTTTDSDGKFVISKIMWKENKPVFGKDGDVSNIYLLFYHENFGLEKGDTMILSDSTSDSVYKEMIRIKKTTNLAINIVDVADDNSTSQNVHVVVTVPQITDDLPDADSVKKEVVIAGNGSIQISYPRWKNNEDRKNNKENEPEVSIEYKMSGDEIIWKACYNGNGETGSGYGFMENPVVSKKVSGDTYQIHLYGKKIKLSVPEVRGTYGDQTDVSNDGIEISMKASLDGGTSYTLDCGSSTTTSQQVGTNGTQSHGNFSGLGQNVSWIDESYDGKFSEIKVMFYANGSLITGSEKTLRSDKDSDSVKL